jgi:hypothetical protein
MTFFGDESEHIRNMASRTNEKSRKPYDYEKEAIDMSEFIPEREDGKQFFHPSELDPRVSLLSNTKDILSYQKYTLRNKLQNLDLGITKEEIGVLAVATTGALVVGAIMFNADELYGVYKQLNQWAEDRLNEYLSPRLPR